MAPDPGLFYQPGGWLADSAKGASSLLLGVVLKACCWQAGLLFNRGSSASTGHTGLHLAIFRQRSPGQALWTASTLEEGAAGSATTASTAGLPPRSGERPLPAIGLKSSGAAYFQSIPLGRLSVVVAASIRILARAVKTGLDNVSRFPRRAGEF